MDSPDVGFVLGAGLGTRLGPLTERRPKPLIPVFNRPLITYTFERLSGLGIQRAIVNTHHRADVYAKVFQPSLNGATLYKDLSLTFRHEPRLLDTAGGVRNIRDLLNDESFLVYNGDILSDLPLTAAIERHYREKNLATLILRSQGGPLQVQVDPATGLICDIGGRIGGFAGPGYLFTGIYLLSPEIHTLIPEGEVLSITPLLVEQIRKGQRVAGVVIDEGHWWDLGNRNAYLEVHRELFPSSHQAGSFGLDSVVHPTAQIAKDVQLKGFYAIGANVVVEAGAVIEDSVIWEDAWLGGNTRLKRCVVRDGSRIDASAADRDF